MEDNKAVIYAIKTGDTCHYIGKTIRESAAGGITKCLISTAYTHEGLAKVFESHKEDVTIEPVKKVDVDGWYDEKLQEVVSKHKDDHPLLNAQWMLDGKRGPEYWRGKKRDAHTLKRLSESKFIRVCQYNDQGNLIKTWAGGKEAAIQVFGDYEVVNNSGKTELYNALRARYIEKKLKLGSYWFREYELIEQFGVVPDILDIEAIRLEQKAKKSADRKKQITLFTTRYTVIQYDEHQNELRRFDNTAEAGYELLIPMTYVQKICRGKKKNNNYYLGFGPKLRQAARQTYPKYKVKIIPHVKPPKEIKHTRTHSVVYHYKNDVLLHTYEGGIKECCAKLNMTESKVRRLCRNKTRFYNRVLILGEKRTIEI